VGGGGGTDEKAPYRQFFKKKLFNKNAIKPIIGDPPRQFLVKTLASQDLSEIVSYPLPWIFKPNASMVLMSFLPFNGRLEK
jgi:hypothetical protein